MQAEPPKSEGLAAGLTRFFTSITGVITSVAALLAAVGTLYIT